MHIVKLYGSISFMTSIWARTISTEFHNLANHLLQFGKFQQKYLCLQKFLPPFHFFQINRANLKMIE